LHWRKEEIENVVVPVIDFSIQKKISDLVEQSFQSKIKSENILKVAKKTIEISIEKSEVDAMKFIKENV
jgi:hypothetical protein